MPVVEYDGGIREGAIQVDPGVVDALIQRVGVPLGFGHREQGEPVVDSEFDFNVAPVVLDELRLTGRIGCG